MKREDFTKQQQETVDKLMDAGKFEVAKSMTRVYQRDNEKAKKEEKPQP